MVSTQLKKLWVVLKNSPNKSQIENRIKKLKIRSIDNLIQILAVYVDPTDKHRYINNAWGSVKYNCLCMLSRFTYI